MSSGCGGIVELQCGKARVEPARSAELRVVALLDDPALIHHHDPVGRSHGRQAMADFFNARPDEISFGQNMTSITFAVSRALSRSWSPGDAIVVTSLDHDANFTPWVRAAADAGVDVRIAEFDTATGVLDPEAIARLLDESVRLVATCVASNAIGTVVDVGAVARAAHEAGALVYLDAVHAGLEGDLVRELAFLRIDEIKMPPAVALRGVDDLVASPQIRGDG